MDKAVVDCSTGKVKMVEMTAQEVADLEAAHAAAGTPPPPLTLEDKLAKIGVTIEDLKGALDTSSAEVSSK